MCVCLRLCGLVEDKKAEQIFVVNFVCTFFRFSLELIFVFGKKETIKPRKHPASALASEIKPKIPATNCSSFSPVGRAVHVEAPDICLLFFVRAISHTMSTSVPCVLGR